MLTTVDHPIRVHKATNNDKQHTSLSAQRQTQLSPSVDSSLLLFEDLLRENILHGMLVDGGNPR
jgi:hypothetical protein